MVVSYWHNWEHDQQCTISGCHSNRKLIVVLLLLVASPVNSSVPKPSVTDTRSHSTRHSWVSKIHYTSIPSIPSSAAVIAIVSRLRWSSVALCSPTVVDVASRILASVLKGVVRLRRRVMLITLWLRWIPIWESCCGRRRRSSHKGVQGRRRWYPVRSSWWRWWPSIVSRSVYSAETRRKMSSKRIRTWISVIELPTATPVPVITP